VTDRQPVDDLDVQMQVLRGMKNARNLHEAGAPEEAKRLALELVIPLVFAYILGENANGINVFEVTDGSRLALVREVSEA
jgi:hypothetical protein